MRTPIEQYDPRTTTLSSYAEDLKRIGMHAISSTGKQWCWIQNEMAAVVRYPTFLTDSPSEKEIKQVLWGNRIGLLSYIREPDEKHPANSFLYVATEYDSEKLGRKERASIRRAMAMTTFDFIDWDTLLEKGFEAYHDTRERAGLSDCDEAGFHSALNPLRESGGMNIIGCWVEEELAGFYIFQLCDDFAEAVLTCSASQFYQTNLNNGLYHHLLDFCLNRVRVKIVSIGLSSIQLEAKSGLHQFKQSVGFEVREVHRVFVFHPALQPVFNRFTFPVWNGIGKIFPRSRYIRKLVGTLHSMGIGEHVEANEPESNKE